MKRKSTTIQALTLSLIKLRRQNLKIKFERQLHASTFFHFIKQVLVKKKI